MPLAEQEIAAASVRPEARATGPRRGGGSLLTWVRITLRWKKLVGWTTLAIVAIGMTVALRLPGRYTAMVVLMPPQSGGASSSAAVMAQLSGIGQLAAAGGGLSMKNPNDQQVALLKSRTVEDAMVNRFHLRELYHRSYQSSARRRWESQSGVDSGVKDGLLRLSVTDSNAARAAEMANGWVEEYRRFSATLAITEAEERRLFYEQQLSLAHDDLVRAEEQMKEVEQRTGVIDAEGQDRTLIASAAVLRGQLAAKQVEIRAMREFAADQNPDLERAEQELSGMEGQLSAMDANSDRQSGDLVAPKGKVTQASLDYARALREVKYRETVQNLLTRQYEGARVDEARQGPQVQVVEPAVPPDTPINTYRNWTLLATLLFALPLALLTAVAAELLTILRESRRRGGSWEFVIEHVAGGARS